MAEHTEDIGIAFLRVLASYRMEIRNYESIDSPKPWELRVGSAFYEFETLEEAIEFALDEIIEQAKDED